MFFKGQNLVEDYDETQPEPWVEPMPGPWKGLAWLAAIGGGWALVLAAAWGVHYALTGLAAAVA